MNKKVKITLIIVATIIVGIIGYSQVMPIIVQTPNQNFIPTQISKAKKTQDNNMALSFLYNITKEKHPTGSQENYTVRDYIVNCLNQMNIEHEVDTQDLNDGFFETFKQRDKEYLKKIIDEQYSFLKKNSKEGNIEKFIKEEFGCNSFDEYLSKTLGRTEREMEENLEEKYNQIINKYKNKTLSNIIAKLNSSDKGNAQNIVFVAHYDSAEETYGAGDNGMNVAGLLETIRCVKDSKFKNNIYVLFTDGEEQGYLGAYSFIDDNNIDVDLIINFDNAGNSGNLILYHYSQDSLTKQYFEAVSQENSYSFTNDILFNKNSDYFQAETSDAFAFIESGYNTIDLALASRPYYYHSEADNFYNIDVKALNNITKSMIEMMSYYGENDIKLKDNETVFNFKLLNGLELSLNKNTYVIVSVILIAINCIYIVFLFTKKEKITKKILIILLTFIAIIALFMFKNFSLLFSIPCFIWISSEFIKNKKIKEISRIALFEGYFFVIIQFITLITQYITWYLISEVRI